MSQHLVPCQRKVAGLLFLLIWSIVLAPTASALTRQDYFDWGPYYSKPQKVLGLTFSATENLPPPTIPPNLIPQPTGGILPGSFFSPLEIAAENILLTFTFDPLDKEKARLSIANERLTEFTTLLAEKKYDAAAQAAKAYQNTLTTLAQNLVNLARTSSPELETFVKQVEQDTSKHTAITQALSFTTPPVATEGLNDILKAGSTVTDAAVDIFDRPAIPDRLSTGIQELKTQGILTPEQTDKIYALDSRASVREELEKLSLAGEIPSTVFTALDETFTLNYPDIAHHVKIMREFEELRTYQTLPVPDAEMKQKIDTWQATDGIPPPPEIRPYLYYNRAEELAKNLDLTHFDKPQQAEVMREYPESVAANPTLVAAQSSPAPDLLSSPSPDVEPGASPAPETQGILPSPLLSPSIAPTEEYLSLPNGALPGDPTYFFKRFGEQFRLSTTFDASAKTSLTMQFADERLREAAALSTDSKRSDDYIDALTSYKDMMQAGKTVLAQIQDEDLKREVAGELERMAARHNLVCEKGLLPPPPGETEIITETIRSTENIMDATADVLGQPAVPPELSDRLEDLKAQGLILPEEAANISNSSSREEARSKIRELTESGAIPLADAKKLDTIQNELNPQEFNQLVEVRKIEELQNLRAIQAEFAQTATLKTTNAGLQSRLEYLKNTIDPDFINRDELTGYPELLTLYDELKGKPRPVNAGQFPLVSPEPSLAPVGEPITPPGPADAVLTACPEGAYFKQSEGCYWKENDRPVNDYDQYRCNAPNQYWSFAAKTCVSMNTERGGFSRGGFPDGQPVCPIGYQWIWTSATCEISTGDPFPSPSLEPFPTPSPGTDPDEVSRRNCPQGASYRPPRGCVWDETDKPIYDYEQYTCDEKGQYYSFAEKKCIKTPEPGTPFPPDAQPDCQESGSYWNWTTGRCAAFPSPVPVPTGIAEVTTPQPTLITPDSPFYFLDRAIETVQVAVAFTPRAREEVRLLIAKERFAESYALLTRGKEKEFKDTLAEYTNTMQQIFNDIDKGINLSPDAKNELAEQLTDQVVEENTLLQRALVLASDTTSSPISAAVSVTIQGLDRAADLSGDPAIPEEIKTRLDSLPEGMLSPEQKQALADIDNRVEARLTLGTLVGTGILTPLDTAVFDRDLTQVDNAALITTSQLRALDEVITLEKQTEEITERVTKTEEISQKLGEFQKTFKPGDDIPSDIRPFVRLTRIEEIAQTIRPDLVKLEDFGNRKDIQLAVATLQQEFKPTKEAWERVENYRRNNPNRPLPPELARIEALSYSLGVRESAGPCYLPSPPFAPNTPCPPPGAAVPVNSYFNTNWRLIVDGDGFKDWNKIRNRAWPDPIFPEDITKDNLEYGQGPKPVSAGVCQNGYHWMYDSGGWCMSNSGNYGSTDYNTGSNYYPPGGDAYGNSGYTPYTPYYSVPGVPPGSPGYQGPGTYYSPGQYTPPSYYGTAPTTYTTNPPLGTVPGTGPTPTSPGQCPSGFHWMPPSYNQDGWCMADGGTYTGGGYSGSTTPYSPYTTSQCAPGQYWSTTTNSCSSSYTPPPSGTGDVSPGDGCGWGYDRDSRGTCYPNNYYNSNTSYPSYPASCLPPAGGCASNTYWDTPSCSCRSTATAPANSSYCTYPGSGCTGYNSYFDWGSCSCKSNTPGSCTAPSWGCGSGTWNSSTCNCQYGTSSGGGTGTYYGGSGSSSCQPPSGGCGSNSWYDYSACSCRSSTSTGSTSTGTSSTSGCSYPSGGCGSGYFDWGSCSCKAASSQGCYNVTASSCGSGFYWDSAACTCRSSGSTSTDTYTPPSSGGSSSGSCSSGYHWMSDNGGWCMSDGGSSSTGTYTPPSTTTSPTTTESQPTQSTAPTSTESQPQQSTAPAPAESTAPQPASSP